MLSAKAVTILCSIPFECTFRLLQKRKPAVPPFTRIRKGLRNICMDVISGAQYNFVSMRNRG
jgi:hypothetical protein